MNPKGRYEILEVLAEGGMGVVYRAFDPVMKRPVTLKTIRDSQDVAMLDLFRRECAVLASMTHPNIVEIFDIGESEEAGAKRPFFVMPLLMGETLQQLIDVSSPRLTVERSINIIAQACRGLQAAHEQGLIHRDLKPSNLFVLADDSVKIIDFGVAHLVSNQSATGIKGTLPYMAPEQLRMRSPTPHSDQFSIAVVCYEILARRHPFKGIGEKDVAQAILRHSPVPASEFNPQVSPLVSQVIHKALAKEPYHRFATIREFADYLQKALRGEAIDKFDPAKIAPRVDRARRAFKNGDLEDASEIIGELESANYLAPEIRDLRKQIDDLMRNNTVKQLLETGRRRFDEGEYGRALQKVQEVLSLDPNNGEAFTLKGAIETRHGAVQIDEWFRLAHQHLENYAYSHARQALEKVLEFRPSETRAKTLLAEIERQEQEYLRIRGEKQRAYDSAVDAYKRGDLNSVINKLDHVLELERRAPNSTSPEQAAAYQDLYETARSKRDQIVSQEAEARRYLTDGNFPAALAICSEVLGIYPNNVVFRALRDDIETGQRQEISAYVAKVEKDVSAEADLNRKVSILEEAKTRYPAEQRFDQALQQVRSRRDMVNAIAARARTLEDERQFSDALGQWETLRNIYPKHPGIDVEMERIVKRRQQQSRDDAKAHWIAQIDQALTVFNYTKANSLMADATAEFPGDAELTAMAKQTQQAQNRAVNAEENARRGRELYATGHAEEALALLREAARLNPHNPMVRSGLLETLLQEARNLVDPDWHAAEVFVREALDLDPRNSEARSLEALLKDKRQSDDVSTALSKARELQTGDHVKDAVEIVDKALTIYPRDSRLIQFRTALLQNLSVSDREGLRARDLDELNNLVKESENTKDRGALESIFQRSGAYAKYGSDEEFRRNREIIKSRLQKEQQTAPDAAAAGAGISASEEQLYFIPDGELDGNGDAEGESEESELVSVDQPAGGRQTLIRNIALVGITFLAIAGAFWFFVVHTSSDKTHTAPAVLLSKLGRLEVRNAAQGEYKILATDGADVTDKAASGLSAGEYTLNASRAGYRAFVLLFTVDPSKEPQKILEVAWQALPAVIKVSLPKSSGGSLKIDGVEQALGNSSEITAELTKGVHSIVWTSQGNSLEVPFEIGDAVILKTPVPRGSVFGLAAVLNGNELTYVGVNVPGGLLKSVDGKIGAVASSGTLSLQTSPPVELKYLGYALGDFQANTMGQPEVYVHIVERYGASAKPSPKTDAAPAPAPVAAPATPQLTDEEIRQRDAAEKKKEYLRKLGVKQ